MLWTSDVVKDPWFPLVKDPSGSMSSYHLSRFTPPPLPSALAKYRGVGALRHRRTSRIRGAARRMFSASCRATAGSAVRFFRI